MDESYKWTRWATLGGKGHGVVGWVAIAAGLSVAIWAFHVVQSWWLAFPAAIFAWLLGTALVGALWACIRRLIELWEGIK